jgi:ribulose bisphosphate carboxylase small subunit
MDDLRPKAQHWTFVKPSSNDADHERILNLCRSDHDIPYVALATCIDDTGNR